MFGFHGKTAIISGAADGLGAAIAERLAVGGAHVVVLDRSAEAIEQAKNRPGMQGLHFEQVDLTDAGDTAAALARLAKADLTFDILVNNAGGSLHTPHKRARKKKNKRMKE